MTTDAPPSYKDDAAKRRYDLLPPEAWLLCLTPAELDGVVRVLEFGVAKYAPHSWALVPNALARYRAAGQRHAEAAWTELNDSESGLPHRWHLLCNAIFCFALVARGQ